MTVCDYQGFLLPLFGESEQSWPNGLRIVLYIMGLFWCFVGIGIISDIFMVAIEKITSKKKKVMNKKTGRYVTVNVWNETVANLTLMALGSSAPEILLSVIELLTNDMYSGELGPSTIIGSAAFNILCISAVCVYAIPSPEVRMIKDLQVYTVTATCSIFAYVWVIFILMAESPDVIEIWEGLLTLSFFPILIFLAYIVDIGIFTKDGKSDKELLRRTITADITPDEIAQIEYRIREEHGVDLTDNQVMRIMEVQYFAHFSRALYHHAAVSAVTGGKKMELTARFSHGYLQPSGVSNDCDTRDDVERERAKRTIEVGFTAARYAAMESCGAVRLPVILSRSMDTPVSVNYKTREGAAKEHTDFFPLHDTLVFSPGETEKGIMVKIVDDVTYEQDEDFFVDLFEPTCQGSAVRLSDIKSVQVWIIDDDVNGFIRFEEEAAEVEESLEDKICNITVLRYSGASGTIGCHFRTEGDTAIPGYDYVEHCGKIEFAPGQQSTQIPITIKAMGRYENSELFRLILYDAFGGAKFDKDTDGGEDACICTITISADQGHKPVIERLISNVHLNWNKMNLGHTNWKNQFYEALFMGREENSTEEQDGEESKNQEESADSPSALDYITHFISLPWKLLFAFVPPVDYCGGWLCFCCSLLMIGVVTAIVKDMASLVGCTLGIRDEITAITFVALGTSLPDTFASKTAAMMDPYADASIGNITGSNSVNVFLGLGIPWTVAAIYWKYTGATAEWQSTVLNKYMLSGVIGDPPVGKFVVPAGTLWFNLMVFSANAFCAIALLAVRRRAYGGELGGPSLTKHLSSAFLVAQWVIYVGLSSWWCTSQDD